MRILICCTLLFVCFAIIPSVQCDRKYKVSEFNERDKRATKARYTRSEDEDEDDAPRYRRDRFRDSDEDFSESKSDRLKRLKREANQQKPQRNIKFSNNEEKTKKIRVKIESDSVEDYTDETDEDLSDVCINKRGGRCESDDLTDETSEDYTDEDDSDDYNIKKKKVIYIKKFAHEKKKPKQDKETGNILKIHRRAGRGRHLDDDDSSEEIVVPKRRRFTLEDDDD